jgi:hypothetical protein
MVKAIDLADARARHQRMNEIFGSVLGTISFEESMDHSIVEMGWWGFKGHTVACGCCGTTRRDWL